MNFLTFTERIKLKVKEESTYRANIIAWFICSIISTIILILFWKVVFSSVNQIGDFDFKSIVFYYITAMVFLVYSSSEWHISHMIKYGEIITKLTKPWNITKYAASFDIGKFIVDFISVSFAMLIVAQIFFGYINMLNPINAFLGIISYILALTMNFFLCLGLAFITTWTKSYYGIRNLKDILISIFSGKFIPLSFFPIWAQKILNFTFFPSLSYDFIMIFMGKVDFYSSLFIMVKQIMWIIIFYLFYKIIFHFAQRKFIGEGI